MYGDVIWNMSGRQYEALNSVILHTKCLENWAGSVEECHEVLSAYPAVSRTQREGYCKKKCCLLQ